MNQDSGHFAEVGSKLFTNLEGASQTEQRPADLIEQDKREAAAAGGFSALHSAAEWGEMAQTLFNIQQLSTDLERRAKHAGIMASYASDLLFLIETKDQAEQLADALSLDPHDVDNKIAELLTLTSNLDVWQNALGNAVSLAYVMQNAINRLEQLRKEGDTDNTMTVEQ